MAEQFEPDTVKEHLKSAVADHSYQTLDPSIDQLTSETHHKGIGEANTEVDVHVQFQPVQHNSEPDQSFGRKLSLKLPAASRGTNSSWIRSTSGWRGQGVWQQSQGNAAHPLYIMDGRSTQVSQSQARQ